MKFEFDKNVVTNHCKSVLDGAPPQDMEMYVSFVDNLDPFIEGFIVLVETTKGYGTQYSAGVMDGIFLVLKSIEAGNLS